MQVIYALSPGRRFGDTAIHTQGLTAHFFYFLSVSERKREKKFSRSSGTSRV
jgi:hypothetical protein